MQARLMRHCCIVFLCFLPRKPRLHALGPIVLRLSAIYEYGVYTERDFETEKFYRKWV